LIRANIPGQQGLFATLEQEQQIKARSIAQTFNQESKRLRDTLTSFHTYMNKKIRKAHGETGFHVARKAESLFDSELERSEQAILKVELLNQIRKQQAAVHLNGQILNQKGKDQPNRLMKELVEIEHDIHATADTLKAEAGDHTTSISLFLFSVIHSFRAHSKHVAINNAYLSILTSILDIAYRAFKADRKYQVNRSEYEVSVKALIAMKENGSLRLALQISDQPQSPSLQEMFNAFDKTLEENKVRLFGGGGSKPQ